MQRFKLQQESQALLTEQQTPAEFLQQMTENRHYHDAVTFLAHGLPAREAVWWSSVCARYHYDASTSIDQAALVAAETWVRHPEESNRRLAEKHAEAGDYATPASWAAAAAFWSGGSISAAADPVMEPPPYLYAHAVAGAIIMAAGFKTPAEKVVEQRYQAYVEHGINIANGGTA
ncbi:MAG: Twin-arginine translocation pathway signal [Gammaproteobacteria bacterium]|nr:Twin-arginine translocation pathway signal [Gammaproteobacteria bacterium]